MRNEVVVGHVPKEISRFYCFVLNSGGRITASVTGRRENKRGNGLEVPCSYKIKGPKTFLSKAEVIINDIVNRK